MPISIELAKEIINDLLTWDIWLNDGDTILKAIDINIRYGFSFWDSMIISAAVDSGAATLLTEDMSDGMEITGVIIKNPFKK